MSFCINKLLVAREDLPDAVVYDLITEVLRLRPALSAAHPSLFHQLSDSYDTLNSTFVLHPGAIAYLERNEPDIYERYSGLAEVFVTMMIAVVSGFYAVVRIYNVRRKNRIDAFYKDAMEIRARGNSTDPAQRRAAIADLRALQDHAFEMLTEEKVAADESFRIFITLVNDIMSDLRNTDADDYREQTR